MITRKSFTVTLIIQVIFSTLMAQTPQGGISFGGSVVTVQFRGTAFNITTPDGWVVDTAFASKLGLRSFFYPVRDTASLTATYFYATCYPKYSENEDLHKFVSADLKRYYENYPGIKKDSIAITKPEGIIAARNYIFTGFQKKYGEQTIFMESKSAILVIVFSARDKADYKSYRNDFSKLFASFHML